MNFVETQPPTQSEKICFRPSWYIANTHIATIPTIRLYLMIISGGSSRLTIIVKVNPESEDFRIPCGATAETQFRWPYCPTIFEREHGALPEQEVSFVTQCFQPISFNLYSPHEIDGMTDYV